MAEFLPTVASELKAYIVINDSLKMGKGKIASQAGHAVAMMVEHVVCGERALWRRYKDCGQPKIVLKASQEQMNEIAQVAGAFVIRDAGRTQISENSLTAICFAPQAAYPHSIIPSLKLL